MNNQSLLGANQSNRPVLHPVMGQDKMRHSIGQPSRQSLNHLPGEDQDCMFICFPVLYLFILFLRCTVGISFVMNMYYDIIHM